jgi:hypothetical protein
MCKISNILRERETERDASTGTISVLLLGQRKRKNTGLREWQNAN